MDKASVTITFDKEMIRKACLDEGAKPTKKLFRFFEEHQSTEMTLSEFSDICMNNDLFGFGAGLLVSAYIKNGGKDKRSVGKAVELGKENRDSLIAFANALLAMARDYDKG